MGNSPVMKRDPNPVKHLQNEIEVLIQMFQAQQQNNPRDYSWNFLLLVNTSKKLKHFFMHLALAIDFNLGKSFYCACAGHQIICKWRLDSNPKNSWLVPAADPKQAGRMAELLFRALGSVNGQLNSMIQLEDADKGGRGQDERAQGLLQTLREQVSAFQGIMREIEELKQQAGGDLQIGSVGGPWCRHAVEWGWSVEIIQGPGFKRDLEDVRRMRNQVGVMISMFQARARNQAVEYEKQLLTLTNNDNGSRSIQQVLETDWNQFKEQSWSRAGDKISWTWRLNSNPYADWTAPSEDPSQGRGFKLVAEQLDNMILLYEAKEEGRDNDFKDIFKLLQQQILEFKKLEEDIEEVKRKSSGNRKDLEIGGPAGPWSQHVLQWEWNIEVVSKPPNGPRTSPKPCRPPPKPCPRTPKQQRNRKKGD